MAHTKYRTAPFPTDRMPPGVPYIIWNEAAERFSFYGMKTILVVFMTQYLMGRGGVQDTMTDETAKFWFHLFVAAVYFTPFLGALISDAFLGKYRTIMSLSLVYCGGHFALALDETRVGLAIGLCLIALGAGGIKPCVSANVGDQFGKANAHLLPKIFSWFYWSINLGAYLSTMLTPWLLKQFGPRIAFGVPGVLMCLATLAFWMGRNKFAHIAPGGVAFLKESFSGDGLRALAKLAVLGLFVATFWSLFDQTGSAWVLQAEKMDRRWLGVEWLSSQIQAVNPLLILVLIPTFSYAIYPLMGRFFRVTPVRKIGIGFFLAAISFAITAVAEGRIQAGQTPSIVWQLVAYVVITCAEVLVSITGLEWSYSQAPPRMKSLIMSLWLASVTLGNAFTALVNKVIERPGDKPLLDGTSYYWFFVIAMLVTAVVWIPVSMRFREKTYIQEDGSGAAPGEVSPEHTRPGVA